MIVGWEQEGKNGRKNAHIIKISYGYDPPCRPQCNAACIVSHCLCLERYGLEYDRKKRQERLETATKSLKTAIVKENMREFRAEQEREQQRRRREYGKVGQHCILEEI